MNSFSIFSQPKELGGCQMTKKLLILNLGLLSVYPAPFARSILMESLGETLDLGFVWSMP